jgi:DNA repair protein RecO (recombination protein O)
MALVKTEGLVIRTMNMGETSKLVTFFTRELGILKVIAKGARAAKSRIGAALEPLTVSRLVYYDRENRELQFLSQADIVEFFPNLPADLEKWGYANACAELVYRAQTSAEATAKLYPILLNTLRAMNEKTADGRVCFWGFQMKLLGVLGVAPNLRKCLHCSTAGPTVYADNNSVVHHFDISRGGFLCSNCSSGRSPHELCGETLLRLGDLQTLPAEKFSHAQIPPLSRREIESFFRAYFAFHLEEIGKLTALKFVREIVGPAASSVQ